MKFALVPLIALTVLGSLAGCGAGKPALPPPPVILNLPDCPAPARPALAPIDGALPFDSPANISTFLERDDVIRFYVQGLEATINCYQRRGDQKPAEEGD
jgi:hypothetical protein